MGVLLAMLLHLHGYRLIVAGPWPGILGVTDTGARTVTLYEQPHEPPALLRKVLAYETGHVLDVSCLTDVQRRHWDHLRHLRGTWYAPDLAPENGYGAGDFANIYSAWFTHTATYSTGPLPRARDLSALAHRFHFAHGVCTTYHQNDGDRDDTRHEHAADPSTAARG